MTVNDDVYEDMESCIAIHPIDKERLRFIDNTNIYANSVNVYVGRPLSGKTYSACHDIISVCRNDENVNCLIYVNEKGECDDDTFERLQDLIECPVVFVKYDECEKYLKKYLEYKHLYNKIKARNLENKAPDEVKEELFEHLFINDFEREYLHTLILLEDATNSTSIKNQKSYINDLLTRCAHTQLSFFILIHYWKALTTNIKANLSTIQIFSGYSRQQLCYMLYQMNIAASMKEIYNAYSSMKQYKKLFVDCNMAACKVI
jgi:hypothetical protein